jgi:hypothetical protein
MPDKDPPVHKGKGCCPKNCFPTSSIKKYLAFSRLLIYLQFGTWGLAFAALMPLETPLSDTFSCIPSAATQHHKRLSAKYIKSIMSATELWMLRTNTHTSS